MRSERRTEFFEQKEGGEIFKFGTNAEKDGAALLALVKKIETTVGEAAETKQVFEAPRPLWFLDAKIISQDGESGNFTFKKQTAAQDGTAGSVLTDTLAKGTVGGVITEVGKFVPAQNNFDVGDKLMVTTDSVGAGTAGSTEVEVIALAMPLS